MQLFENIIKTRDHDKYNSILIYPSVTPNKGGFQTKKIDKILLSKIKDKIKKFTKNKSIHWQQIESYYKNLSKIEKIFLNGTTEINYFIKTNNNFVLETNNNLVIFENVQNIAEDQFPSLSDYDKIVQKTMEKYNIENIDIIFISQDNETTIYVDASNVQTIDKIKFKNLFEDLF